MTEENDFNLHIHYESSYYDGDTDVECTVTYPGVYNDRLGKQKLPDITITYGHGYDDNAEKAAERAAKDIAAYILNPHAFLEDRAIHGSDRAKLAYLCYKREEAEKSLKSHQHDTERLQRSLQKCEQEIATLQASLGLQS